MITDPPHSEPLHSEQQQPEPLHPGPLHPEGLQSDPLQSLVPRSPILGPTGSGPLDSIDVVVKDIVAVAGHTSSFGHDRWRDTHRPAERTSPVIERLRRAGAQVVGFTKLDQLAYSIIGNVGEGGPDAQPANPRNPELWTGGSSSGTASMVAGSRAQLGVGTDTAGSVRVPAALCGIHGLRPTWGRIDTTGVLPLAPSFDTVGLLAAHPTVLRRGFAVLVDGRATLERGPDPVIERVLVAPSLMEHQGDATRHAVVTAAATIAKARGAEVLAVDLDHLVNRDVAALFSRLQGREIWAQHRDWVTAHGDALDDDVRERLRRCAEAFAESPEEVRVDELDRRRYRELLADVLGDRSVLVLPVVGHRLPHRSDDRTALAAFRAEVVTLMAPASLAGLPQLTWTLPGGGDPRGASVGLVAPAGGDEALLELLEDVAVA